MAHAAKLEKSDELSWYMRRIDGIASAMEAYDFLRSIAAGAGFRHFTVLRFARDAESGIERQLVMTSLPQSIVRDYAQNSLAIGSRALSVARRSVQPFLWNPAHPRGPLAGNDNRSSRNILARVGVTMGLTLPVSSWRSVRGLVMFGGERDMPRFDEVARLSLVANCLFDRLVEFGDSELGADDFRLTAREKQCLIWTSAGKTSAEIAGILGLSEHTVNQYVATSTQKLGAVNRTQAVAKAIRLRLID